MLLRRSFLPGIALALSLGGALCVMAADKAETQVKVVLFSLPESVWQKNLEGQYHGHQDLFLRLEKHQLQNEAQRPVDVVCHLKPDEPFEWKLGQTRKFTTGWQVLDRAKGLGVEPRTFEDRFVGTTLRIDDAWVRSNGAFSLELALEHHTAPPAMRRINYAQAVEGADRDRHSVEYPEFTKLEWKGKVTVTPAWQLVAQMLYAPEAEEPETGGTQENASATEQPKTHATAARRHLLFIIDVIP